MRMMASYRDTRGRGCLLHSSHLISFKGTMKATLSDGDTEVETIWAALHIITQLIFTCFLARYNLFLKGTMKVTSSDGDTEIEYMWAAFGPRELVDVSLYIHIYV